MALGQILKKTAIFGLFGLFLTTGFFCSAEIIPEQALKNRQVELKERDAKMIMRGLIQKISNNWVDIVASPDMTIENELVMAVMGKAIRAEVANYLLVDMPQQVGKEVLKASVSVARLLLLSDPSPVIGEIERLSVDKAKEYSQDWLYQNEIRMNSGELPLSYQDVDGNWQNLTLPYIIAFKKIDDKRATVSVGVYSSKTIKAPLPIKAIPWEGGIKELSPFVLRATGVVKENFFTYSWVEDPQIEAIFDEPVPEFSFPKKSLVDKAKEYVIELIPGLDLLGIELGQELRSLGEEEIDLSNINLDGIIEEEEEEEPEPVIEKKETEKIVIPEPKEQVNLEEIEEALNEIAKQIESLKKEISGLAKDDEEAPKEVVKKETKKTVVAKETTKKVVSTGGGSSVTVAPSYCEISEENALSDKVVINEISWMGTSESSNDEWIELKNITEEDIPLSGWQLLDKGRQIKVIFTGQDIIPAQGFYLLERTDDNSVSDITADNIYTGSLNDSNEALYLFNSGCQIEDEAIANPDWQAGDKEEKKTMERGEDLTWHTYSGDGEGTPKEENSEIEVVYAPSFDNSPWPMYQGNPGRNNQGLSQGPLNAPSIQWVYSNEEDPDHNFIYTSPVIDDTGIIYTSIISSKKGILSINPDGTEIEFIEKDISGPLMGKGSELIADDKLSQATAEDGSYYNSAGNILLAFDKDSLPKWQRTFEKPVVIEPVVEEIAEEIEEPVSEPVLISKETCPQANPYLLNPVAGKDGMIYVVVRDMDCDIYGDRVDYLYILTSDNAVVSEINLSGFSTSQPSVSSDGGLYLVNAHYGKYSAGSYGELKGLHLGELKWRYELWKDTSGSLYSGPIIDSLGNTFFIYGKNILAFDRDGNGLWELPIDVEYLKEDLSMALSSDGTIYISGKGGIIAVK